MTLNFDWKCGVTNAILTVLVYLLLLKLLPGSGNLMNDSSNWFESLEVLLLLSAFVAFNVNGMLFNACMTSRNNVMVVAENVVNNESGLMAMPTE
jgi:hypothetical protein